MLSKKLFSLSFAVIFCCLAAFSQKNYINKANKLLSKFQYAKALPLFKATYEATESPDALIGIVESLKGIGNLSLPENEGYLATLSEFEGLDPKYKLLYGQHLMSNDKYEAAKALFSEYAKLKPKDSRGVSFLKKAARLAEEREESGFYEIYTLDMNTEYDDYSPIYYNDGFLFSSDRGGVNADRIYGATGRPYCDIYYSPAEATEPAVHSTAELWGNNINTMWHEGTCDITEDGETFYFTRDNFHNKELRESEDDIVKLKIYTAKKLTDGTWTIFNELSFNSDEYSVMHPSLSLDGNALYFSSDMPGGYGGADIYVSYKVGASWGDPQNLGPNVNSEGREVFPFIGDDNTTLYYASDGLAGFGGLDIFKTKLKNNNWREAINLGKPMNSGQDDFGLVMDDNTKTGYFTSRREGGQGLDDVYTFKKCLVLQGLVFDKDTDLPIPEANVIVEDASGNVIYEDYTNEDGVFKSCIEENANYTVTTSHPDYPVDGKLEFNSNNTNGELLTINVPMFIPPPPPPQTCAVVGLILNKDTKKPIPGIRVMVQSDSKGAMEDIYSDSKGNFTFDAMEDETYRVSTNSDYYYTGSSILNNKNKKCEVIVRTATKDLTMELEPIQLGVTVVLNHIYYDLDEYYIREDAKPELNRLLNILMENPGISIELSSHTDSRASDEYNLALSQKRADEAKNYLVGRGIASNRIEPVGYGESRLVNECANGVKCKNKRHQENRRTEFMVMEVNSGLQFSSPKVVSDQSMDGGTNYYTEEMRVYQAPASTGSVSSGSTYTPSKTKSASKTRDVKKAAKDIKRATRTVEKEVKKASNPKKATTKKPTSGANKGKLKKIDGKEYYENSPEYEAAKKRKIEELIRKRKEQMKNRKRPE